MRWTRNRKIFTKEAREIRRKIKIYPKRILPGGCCLLDSVRQNQFYNQQLNWNLFQMDVNYNLNYNYNVMFN